MDNWVLWVLVSIVGVAAIYFVFVRKLVNKTAPAPEKAHQPPAAP
jgi:hypothetical protein